MTTLQDVLTPEIREFLDRNGILGSLHTALTIVRECFPDATGIRADVVWDPESGDESVGLIVTVPGTVEEVLKQDDRFMDRWIAEMPWPASDRIVVLPEIV